MIPQGGEQICQDLMEQARQEWDRAVEAVLEPARPAQEQRLALSCGELVVGAYNGAAVADDWAVVEERDFSASAEDFGS